MSKIRITSGELSRIKVTSFPAHRSIAFSAASFTGSEALLSHLLLSVHEALAHGGNDDLWSLLIPFDLKIVFYLDW